MLRPSIAAYLTLVMLVLQASASLGADQGCEAALESSLNDVHRMIALGAGPPDPQRDARLNELRRAIEARDSARCWTHSDKVSAREANNTGLKLLQDGDDASAIKAFREGYTADPTDEEVMNNLGYGLVRTGDFEGAVRTLLRTLTLAPGRANAWANLGQAYGGAGSATTATACFANALHFSRDRNATQRFLERLIVDGPEAAREAARQVVTAMRMNDTIAGGEEVTPRAEREPTPTNPVEDGTSGSPALRLELPLWAGLTLVYVTNTTTSIGPKKETEVHREVIQVIAVDNTDASASIQMSRDDDPPSAAFVLEKDFALRKVILAPHLTRELSESQEENLSELLMQSMKPIFAMWGSRSNNVTWEIGQTRPFNLPMNLGLFVLTLQAGGTYQGTETLAGRRSARFDEVGVADVTSSRDFSGSMSYSGKSWHDVVTGFAIKSEGRMNPRYSP